MEMEAIRAAAQTRCRSPGLLTPHNVARRQGQIVYVAWINVWMRWQGLPASCGGVGHVGPEEKEAFAVVLDQRDQDRLG
jgi:hypothetical protein